MHDLAAVVDELVAPLLPHLDVEELVFFPALTEPVIDQERVARELSVMQTDHHDVATLLHSMREAAEDFAVPTGACRSYRTLLSELKQLESDVFAHVHLENHVLRPRFERI